MRQPGESANYKEIIQRSQFQQEFKSEIVTVISYRYPWPVLPVSTNQWFHSQLRTKTSKEKLDKTRALVGLGEQEIMTTWTLETGQGCARGAL